MYANFTILLPFKITRNEHEQRTARAEYESNRAMFNKLKVKILLYK